MEKNKKIKNKNKIEDIITVINNDIENITNKNEFFINNDDINDNEINEIDGDKDNNNEINDNDKINEIDDDKDDDNKINEIDEDDDNNKINKIEDEDDETVYFKFNTTNHKLEGKHRLKRDTIFYGKIDEEENDEMSSNSTYFNKDFPIEKGTIFEMESTNYEELNNQRTLKKNIYNILYDQTDIAFTSNRRKPNKQAFNNYYEILLKELHNKHTKSEIFVELSYYFTDHIFNMYKLLYPEHATNIIKELKDKGYLNELNDMKFV